MLNLMPTMTQRAVPLSFVASDGINFEASANSVAVAMPAAVEDGDLLLAFAYQTVPNDNTGGIDGPDTAGWTSLGEYTHTDTDGKAEIFYKTASSEVGFNMDFSETIDTIYNNRHYAGLLAFRSAGTPVSQSQTEDTQTDPIVESFTEPATNSFEVILIGMEDFANSINIASALPATFTNLTLDNGDHSNYGAAAIGWRANTDLGAVTWTIDIDQTVDAIRYRIRVPAA